MGQLAEQEVWETKAFQDSMLQVSKMTKLPYKELWELLDCVNSHPVMFKLAIQDILLGCSYYSTKEMYSKSFLRLH